MMGKESNDTDCVITQAAQFNSDILMVFFYELNDVLALVCVLLVEHGSMDDHV